MDLVIVESPTKARTLTKFLGKDYRIEASMGHIRDLPANRLGIDVNHDFTPTYLVPPDRKKTIADLKSLAEKATRVILATDPDREGEAIAWHVATILNSSLSLRGAKRRSNLNLKRLPRPSLRSGLAMTGEKFSRIVFHEITEAAIKDALEHPRGIDQQLVDAQQARRILDRLVGYKLSPLLWSKVRRGLSAGRVQSVALRIICEREKERAKFKTEEYWTITLKTSPHASPLLIGEGKGEVGATIDFELISKDGIKYETQQSFTLYDGKYTVGKSTILTKEQADLIARDIYRYSIYISDIEKKAIKRTPPPPFTTSTLQQEAGRRLGFSTKRTMQISQRLYEEGLITYHRTDSVNLAEEAINKCRLYIEKELGKEYVPQAPRIFKTKQKLAQEAHEAIRPTNVEVGSGKWEAGQRDGKLEMGRDEERIYNLIWKRFVACQMKEAEIEGTTVFAKTSPLPSPNRRGDTRGEVGYLFKATGSMIVFPGFLKVYPEALEENKLPIFNKDEELQKDSLNPVQHFTQPPPRYSEATLVATLEEKGIGRPSTYAPIISTIKERHYVEVEDLPDGRHGKRLIPSALGIAVNDFLVLNFSEIDDMPFTAGMEDEFDQIAQGQKQWVPVIKEFFEPFSQKLQSVYKTSERVKIETEETNEKCAVCGSPLLIRVGKFGKFLACSRFPDCKFTKPLTISTGLKCPQDEGEVIIRKTKKGKTFYGCSNYPKCNWASWTKPKDGRG